MAFDAWATHRPEASSGGPVGRHDKDIPTLWENCWYIGGKDDGRFRADDLHVGVGLCAELGHTVTADRKPEEGPGVIVADVEVGQTEPLEVLPVGEWIRPLAGLGKIMWNVQQAHGRKWYRMHMR